MSPALIAPAGPTRPGREHPIDSAGLWPAVDRVAGAAFCTDLDPTVISFARTRIADHFAVAQDVIDAMIAIGLVSLATRLGEELESIAAL